MGSAIITCLLVWAAVGTVAALAWTARLISRYAASAPEARRSELVTVRTERFFHELRPAGWLLASALFAMAAAFAVWMAN
jgi:hypothetical protein